MNKKIVFILVLVVIVLAGGSYYLLGKKDSSVTQTQNPVQIKKVLDEAVVSPVGAFDNNSIWYFNSEGRLFKVNSDGSNLSEFSLPIFPSGNLIQALWPKIGSDFIAISRNDGQIAKSYYDSTSKLFMELAPNIQWVEWLPDGKRVVYIWQSNDKKTQQLVMSNADGSGYKSITSVFWPDLVLKASPDGNTVLMYRSQVVGDTNKIYSANLATGVISTWVDTGKNTAASWLPVGNKFLYVQNSKIYLFDVLNQLSTDTKLNTTLEKTVVDSSGKILYAAVPKEDKTGDYFVKLNLSSNITENYFVPETQLNVKSLMLIGNTVYYLDNKDNKLYKIE